MQNTSSSELSAAAACFVPCDYRQSTNPIHQGCSSSESHDHGHRSDHESFWPPAIPYNSYYASRPPPFMNIPPPPLHINSQNPQFSCPNLLPPPPIQHMPRPMFRRGESTLQCPSNLPHSSRTIISKGPIAGKNYIGLGASYTDNPVEGFLSINSRSAGDMSQCRGNNQKFTVHHGTGVSHPTNCVDNSVNVPVTDQRVVSMLCHDQLSVTGTNDRLKFVTNCSASELSGESQSHVSSNGGEVCSAVRILSKSAKRKQKLKKKKTGDNVGKDSIGSIDALDTESRTASGEACTSGFDDTGGACVSSNIASSGIHRLPADKPGKWNTETQTDFSDDLAGLTLAEHPNVLYHCPSQSTGAVPVSSPIGEPSPTSVPIASKPNAFGLVAQSLLSWSDIVNKPPSSRSTSIGKPRPIPSTSNQNRSVEAECQNAAKSKTSKKSLSALNRSRETRPLGSAAQVVTTIAHAAVDVAEPMSNKFADMSMIEEINMKSVASKKANRNRKKKKVPTASLR